jgi:hypothetical protein
MPIVAVAMANLESLLGDDFREDPHQESISRHVGIVGILLEMMHRQILYQREVRQWVISSNTYHMVRAPTPSHLDITTQNVVLVSLMDSHSNLLCQLYQNLVFGGSGSRENDGVELADGEEPLEELLQ